MMIWFVRSSVLFRALICFGLLILFWGCGREPDSKKQAQSVAPSGSSSNAGPPAASLSSGPTSPIDRIPLASIDDWAFIPSVAQWPSELALPDAEDSFFQDENGVHMSEDGFSHPGHFVLRKRFTGNFKLNLVFSARSDAESPEEQQREPVIYCGTRANNADGMVSWATVPLSMLPPAAEPGLFELRFESAPGQGRMYLGDQFRLAMVPDSTSTASKYFAIKPGPDVSMSLLRCQIDGESDQESFVKPTAALVPFGDEQWSVFADGNVESTNSTIGSEEIWVRSEKDQKTHLRYQREMQGDFVLKTRMEPTQKSVAFIRFTPVDPNGRSKAVGMTFTKPMPITILRHEDNLYTLYGKKLEKETVPGSLFVSVQCSGSDIRFSPPIVHSDAVSDPVESKVASVQFGGWRLSTPNSNDRNGRPRLYEVIGDDDLSVKISVDPSSGDCEATRTTSIKGDFNTRWRMNDESTNQVAATATVTPLVGDGRKISIPIPGGGQQDVSIRRQGLRVAIECGSESQVEYLGSGALSVTVTAVGGSRLTLADFESQNIERPKLTEVPITGFVRSVTRAGGGRFLLLNCVSPTAAQLFDLKERKVVATVPLEQRNLFCGGLDHVIHYCSADRCFRRYDLPNLREQAKSQPLTIAQLGMNNMEQTPAALVSGYASNNVFVVVLPDRKVIWYDSRSMKPVAERPPSPDVDLPPVAIACSPDGRYVGVMKSGKALTLETGGQIKTMENDWIQQAVLRRKPQTTVDGEMRFPALSGPFALRMIQPSRSVLGIPLDTTFPTVSLAGRTVMTLDEFSFLGSAGFLTNEIPLDDRFTFDPDNKTVAFIPESDDRIQFLDLDPEVRFQDALHPILVAANESPPTAYVGERYEYQIPVFSNRPPLQFLPLSHTYQRAPYHFSLDVDSGILLTRSVNERFEGKSVGFDIFVTDQSGKKLRHEVRFEVLPARTREAMLADARKQRGIKASGQSVAPNSKASDGSTQNTAASPKPEPTWRIWSDRSGKFSVKAKMVEVVGAECHLEREDGSIAKIKIELLSEIDQGYIKRMTTK